MNKLTRLLTTTLMALGVALPCNSTKEIKCDLFGNTLKKFETKGTYFYGELTEMPRAELTDSEKTTLKEYWADTSNYKFVSTTTGNDFAPSNSTKTTIYDNSHYLNNNKIPLCEVEKTDYTDGTYNYIYVHFDLTLAQTNFREKTAEDGSTIIYSDNASDSYSSLEREYAYEWFEFTGVTFFTENENGMTIRQGFTKTIAEENREAVITAMKYTALITFAVDIYVPIDYGTLYFTTNRFNCTNTETRFSGYYTYLTTESDGKMLSYVAIPTINNTTKNQTTTDNSEQQSLFNSMEEQNEQQSSQIQSYESQIEQLWDLAKTQREMLETAITNYNTLNLTTFSHTWTTTTDSDLESYVKENTLVGKKLTGIQNNQLQDLQTQIEKLKSELEQAETNYKNATSSLLDINTKAGASYESWREKALEAGINIDDITSMEKGISSSFGTGTTLYYINAMSGLMQLYNNKVVNGDSGAYGDYTSTIQYLNAQVDELTTKYNNLLNDYNEQGDKVDELTAKIKENETTIAQLQAQIKTMQQDYSDYTWDSYFWALASTPFTFISSFLNFNVMGVNVFALVSTLLTMGLIIYLIRKLI